MKNPQQNVSKKNLKKGLKIMYHVHVEFIPYMQGWFSIWKSVNVIHNVSRVKKEKS